MCGMSIFTFSYFMVPLLTLNLYLLPSKNISIIMIKIVLIYLKALHYNVILVRRFTAGQVLWKAYVILLCC